MSGKPHPEGVKEVVALLARVEDLDDEARRLRPQVERLRLVEEEAATERGRLKVLLRSMDLESTGNYGWESRLGWFLAEMRRQVRDE